MKNWKEPAVVALDFAETMANVTPCEHPDDSYGGLFEGGRGFDGCQCGKS